MVVVVVAAVVDVVIVVDVVVVDVVVVDVVVVVVIVVVVVVPTVSGEGSVEVTEVEAADPMVVVFNTPPSTRPQAAATMASATTEMSRRCPMGVVSTRGGAGLTASPGSRRPEAISWPGWR